MAITIQRGNTEDARREYTCYSLAYAFMQIKVNGDTVIVWTFDNDAADIIRAMEHNTVVDIKTGAEAVAIVKARKAA